MTQEEYEAWLNKTKLPPGSRWHHWYCSIFEGGKCDCDDDRRTPPTRRKRPSAGGAAKREEEMA